MTVLLQVRDLSKRFGARTILEEATASFSEGQKIGVIGPNGAGKSTLCKIIIGEEDSDGGTITKNSALRLSYLEQHDPFEPGETVTDFLMRYTQKEEWECGQIAAKFQLKNEWLEKKISELAGGYRTRVKLTAMLLRDPNFLILDEPTNYLDLSTLILLENFLNEFEGGFLIVSHDREFLKRTCEHTLEVMNGRLTLYPGNIEEYFTFKEEMIQQKMAYNKNIEKKKEQLQEFVDRFRAKASTATRAKSKMKQIEKLKTIEIEHSTGKVHIHIPVIERKAGVALSCQDLAVGYPEKQVANRIHLEIDRGIHVAVLGDNGQGKTTFLRTLAGDLERKAGSFNWGTGLKIAYYAQHVNESLPKEQDVYTYLLQEAAEGVTTQDVLNMAGSFLFKGDDTKKKIPVLSGGERARLCLAGILLRKNHVLLLDEPTNHLDFDTVEALGKALKKFHGTVFFISHDRTFVNLVATAIIEVKNGSIKKYPGTYEDYVYHLECEAHGLYGKDPDAGHPASSAKHSAPPSPPPSAETRQLQERKQVKSEITALKTQILKSESRLKHYAEERDGYLKETEQNPFHYSRQRSERMKQLTSLIEKEEAAWLDLQNRLEALKKS